MTKYISNLIPAYRRPGFNSGSAAFDDELIAEEEKTMRDIQLKMAERNAFMVECILFGGEVAAKASNGEIANALLQRREWD